jgi:hypothetical protein
MDLSLSIKHNFEIIAFYILCLFFLCLQKMAIFIATKLIKETYIILVYIFI